jgi:hypothetical protein
MVGVHSRGFQSWFSSMRSIIEELQDCEEYQTGNTAPFLPPAPGAAVARIRILCSNIMSDTAPEKR